MIHIQELINTLYNDTDHFTKNDWQLLADVISNRICTSETIIGSLHVQTKHFTKNDWRLVSIAASKSDSDVTNFSDKYLNIARQIKTHFSNIEPSEATYRIRNNIDSRPCCPNCGNEISFRTDPKPYYPTFCSMSCRSQHKNSVAEPIIIDGIRYKDFQSAIDETNLTRLELRRRVFDVAFPTYQWDCDDHHAKCLEKLKSHHSILVDYGALVNWKTSGMTQTEFCDMHGMKDTDPLRYALRFFGIESKYDQVDQTTRDFLEDQQRFTEEFNKHSMERLADIYSCSTGTIKNYAKKYGLDTTLWSTGVSKAENELYEFVRGMFPDAVQSYREVFGKNGLELDIFIPSKNIGVEFNGVFTHSDKVKDSDYHREKHLKFRSHNIRYIQIWEDDWTHRNDKVKRFLTNALGFNVTRIGARETIVQNISQPMFDAFMDDNHMQGSTKCKYRIGLFKDGVLLSAMGFREVPKNHDNLYGDGYGIDLTRFANTTVTGAFTKLLKHFERQSGCNFVLSYADLEIVSPFKNVYSTNGFSVVKEIKQDYRYYNRKTNVREHKFNWRKQAFERLGISIDGKTEFQLADEYGLLRCYDSGKILYIKKCHAASQIKQLDC